MMEVISTRRYEARPAASAHSGILVDPENSVATVKEEEWETRKKKEITTTRQIETRVKRQVVLEDGEVVVDSGPLVTTNTTEDVEQQEHTTQERRTTGDEPKEVEWPSQGSGIVQKELNETVVRSREEVEERLETEDRQQLGDISDEAYQHAIRNNRGDLRVALAESSKQLVPQSGPRVLQHTTKSKKVIDTENKLERKALQEDGLILTETKKTVEHEEIKDDEVPDDGTGEDGSDEETRKECSQRFLKKKDEDVVDYVSGGERVAREMRYISEETEGERIGDWPPPPTTMRTARLHKHGFPADGVPTARKDALTKKPLDLEEEDEARKVETSKWLESHFGSESRSSHGSLEPDDPPVHTGTNTSFINVTMKSLPIQSTARDREYANANSSRHRVSGRDSNSPSGYFHGISEWSERYQGSDKQNNYPRTSSPSHYATEPVRSNGYSQENSRNQVESSYNRTYESSRRQQEHQEQQRHDAPSPPLRRRVREQLQLAAKAEEKNNYNDRTSSPVHVVQRTWESRSRNVQGQNIDREAHRYGPQKTSQRSRSTSPIPAVTSTVRRDKKSPDESVASRTSNKTSSQSKYKIGESFRKLVGKLRSASTERKNKRSGGSTSQLTQTDDSSTYLQYNVIDRNIPLVSEYDAEDKPPERPPRSPKTGKVIRSAKMNDNHEQWQRNDSSAPPVHRYYLGEDPFGGSIYGREKGYRDAKPPGRQRTPGRFGAEAEYSVESNSLGRFSKSTSRLANDYDRDEQFRSVQTLPRKLHYTAQSRQTQQSQNQRHHVNVVKQSNRTVSRSPQSTVRSNKARQYGSMINISIKNAVTAPKGPKRDQYPEQKHGDIGKSVLQGPAKPERTYKSSLSRSKSFNVEASRNGVDFTSPSSIPYKSNLQLNRLDENPAPLKSPGILASISRSNRDLFKAAKYEY